MGRGSERRIMTLLEEELVNRGGGYMLFKSPPQECDHNAWIYIPHERGGEPCPINEMLVEQFIRAGLTAVRHKN
jgi:hypothetical protein